MRPSGTSSPDHQCIHGKKNGGRRVGPPMQWPSAYVSLATPGCKENWDSHLRLGCINGPTSKEERWDGE